MKYFYTIFTLLLLMACKEKKEVIRPEVTDINESVYASGIILPAKQYKVYCTTPGIIQKKLVVEGQQIAVGQTLFVIENKNPEINVQNAILALELAKENASGSAGKLKELALNIQLAKEKLALDSLLFARQKDLWKQGIGTQNDFDQRQLAYTSSINNLQTAESRYALLAMQLSNEVQRAENNLRLAKSTRGDYEIKSEISGKVYDVLKEVGEQGNLQEPLAIIGDSSNFILELQVDEYDIAKLQVGQITYVNMDSYKGQVFEARITKIYPSMNERTRSFKVEAVFTKGPQKLYPNLSAEANIIIRSRKNILTIPREYITEKNEVVLENGKKTIVKTGIQDLEKVEITSGIDINTPIIKPE